MKDYDNQYLVRLRNILLRGEPETELTGLSGTARSYFFSRLLPDLKRPCLVILPEADHADDFYRELSFFMGNGESEKRAEDRRIHQFPPYDLSPLTGLSPHRELSARRVESLYTLISQDNPVVITSVEALSVRILPKETFVRVLEYLEAGEEIERASLLQRLEITGYSRSSLVEEIGDYSVRGGVIDLFPPLHPLPVRLEFWGDRLESIRFFDPLSQRSQEHIDEMVLLPASEIIIDEENVKRARTMGRLPRQAEESMRFPGQEAWLNHFYPNLNTLFHYIPSNGLVVLFDPGQVEAVSRKQEKKFFDDLEKFRLEAAEKGSPFPECEDLFVSSEEMDGLIKNYQRLSISELDLDVCDGKENKIHVRGQVALDDDLELRLEGRGRVSLAPLAAGISKWLSSRAIVVLVTRTEQQTERLREILENYQVAVDRVVQSWDELPETPGLSICLGRLSKGFTWPDLGLYVISEDEIFGPKRARSRKKSRDGVLAWSSLSQLRTGDLVVHEDHGIGRYGGLMKMEIEQKVNDFVIIEYSHKDKLYIPADRISVLQRYVGADDKNPKLDQLGGRSWDVAKQKARNAVKTIAKQLVAIYALRRYREGFEFSPPDNYFREFEASFEHEETQDQIKAIEDVIDDMTSNRPMDRLICGDVGFGKTEVAIRAAFKAVTDSKQVAILVPTTVLAEQHYETFRKRMDSYPVRVGILSRFKTGKEQAEMLRRLRSGEIDILIGTHRIIQKDVKFKDLGLLIIDEEQRFGVKQKEALKKYRSLVDVLAITATPIPRTLQMSMMGIRDLSIIETPPEERLAIQSYISAYDESLIVRAIDAEIERGGQVFFVHNKVQNIEYVADRVKQLVPHARIRVAHGQMKGKDLESTMMHFIRKEIDVLVCSTIIESGLDIPSANTIIINEADRLGLAQIYQLRGRVGRAKEKAYAYMLLSEGSELTRDAEKRLKALMDFSHLGAGLHLAMHDLTIRGGGNILGFVQSGQISAIGYELYMKLIEQAVAELKGEEWHEDINPEINMDISAFLPEDYVSDMDVRLNLYRRLSGLDSRAELKRMEEEITDRFGRPPREVINLLELMSIRLLLKRLGVSRLDVGNSGFILTFSKDTSVDSEWLANVAGRETGKFQFLDGTRLKVNMGWIVRPQDIKKIEAAVIEILSPGVKDLKGLKE